MTLYIKTDLKDFSWLTYIIEEFKRINLAEFNFSVVGLNENISSENVLYYSKEYFSGINFPNRSEIIPTSEVKFINENIFIVSGTEISNPQFSCDYDLFWNAFVFLSRLEEYNHEKNGKKIKSYSFNHPRTDKSTFHIPVVNNLFNELEGIIHKNFPNLCFLEKRKPIIEFSHDVDYISKTIQLRIKQTVFNGFNFIKTLSKPALALQNLRKIFAFLFSNTSYWCFDYWEGIEKSANIYSTFYFYAKSPKQLSLRKKIWGWLVDPSYDIKSNVKLQSKIRQLLGDGFQIGLHGSYESALSFELLKKEKEILERITERPVTKTRQHWLNFDEATPLSHNKLFKFDSTIGWNDRMGFRSGIISQYKPYDHKENKPFDYIETPFVLMDSHIFDYGADKLEANKEKAFQLIGSLNNFKNAHLSICWHQRVCSADYNWHPIYKQLLK